MNLTVRGDGGEHSLQRLRNAAEVAGVESPLGMSDIITRSLQVLFLAREAFERLIGPMERLLAECVQKYDAVNLAANSGTLNEGIHPQVRSHVRGG